MNSPTNDALMRNSVFAWLALAVGLVLLIPLIAMRFADQVTWDAADFVVMGCLLFATGGLLVLVYRKSQRRWRVVAGLLVLAAFLYAWAELAVGIFTNLGS